MDVIDKLILEEIENFNKKKTLRRNIDKHLRPLLFLDHILNNIKNIQEIDNLTKEKFNNLKNFLDRDDTFRFFKEVLEVPQEQLSPVLNIFHLVNQINVLEASKAQKLLDISKKYLDNLINKGSQKIEDLKDKQQQEPDQIINPSTNRSTVNLKQKQLQEQNTVISKIKPTNQELENFEKYLNSHKGEIINLAKEKEEKDLIEKNVESILNSINNFKNSMQMLSSKEEQI